MTSRVAARRFAEPKDGIMIKQSRSKVLENSTSQTVYTMLSQFWFRLITFGMNMLILRYTSAETLGVANVRLTSLYTAVLFLSREAFRRSYQGEQKVLSWQKFINLLWLVVPFGVVVALAGVWLWLSVLTRPLDSYYVVGVRWYTCAALVELLAEPLWIISKMRLHVRISAQAEALANTARVLVIIFFIVVWPLSGSSLRAFCYAQMTYAVVTCAVFYWRFLHDKVIPVRDLWPRPSAGLDRTAFHILWGFLLQSQLKLWLSEGERYLMTFFNLLTFAEQGVFDAVSNLGALPARLLLAPLEDGFFLFFSHRLQRGLSAAQQLTDDKKEESVMEAAKVLHLVFRLVVLIGMTFLFFGQAYSFLLLDLYGGALLSSGSGPLLMRAYCLVTLLLAVNGISEGFMNATMSVGDLQRYNANMVVYTTLQLGCAVLLVPQLGALGFLIAISVVMMLRIATNLRFVVRYFSHCAASFPCPCWGLLLSGRVLGAFIFSALVTGLSEHFFLQSHVMGGLWSMRILHICVGAFCFVSVITVVWRCERLFCVFILNDFLKIKRRTF